jgi:ferredoxin
MAFVIAEPCRDCKDAACVEVCPVDCIKTTPSSPQYYIDPSECICCQMCVPVCPVEAIFEQSDLPESWAGSAEINRLFFQECRE